MTKETFLRKEKTQDHSSSDKGLKPNQPDKHGVTPLMHASTLGHSQVIKVIMEHNRTGSVTIDIGARDDTGRTALDHAISSNNNNDKEVKELLTSYNSDAGAIRCPTPAPFGEAIELVDMRTPPVSGQNSPMKTSQKHLTPEAKTSKNCQNEKIQEDRDSSIKRWAVDVKKQHEEAGRLSSLVSPSMTSTSKSGSRPGSSLGIPLNERPASSLSLQGRPRHHGPSSSRLAVRNYKRNDHASSGEDDDEDISLESLSDLLGTVRQYAKEIHEIYAPIQKDEEERIRKRNERNAKRKLKEQNKVAAAKTLAPPNQQEVRVEIHKLEDQMKEKIQGKGRGRSRPDQLTHSKSHEPSMSQPVALLHVENEQLSSTWPRGRNRSKSGERFWSDMPHEKQKANTIHAVSSTSSFTRPQIPADWNEANSIQHERDILNKAFQRIHKPGHDPLLDSHKNPAKPQVQKQVQTSRQSVIQIAKQHKQARQAALPSISVIPPPAEPNSPNWGTSGGVLPSASPTSERPSSVAHPSAQPIEDATGNEAMIPPAHVVTGDGPGHAQRQSKNGGAGVKSSSKAGLRRRRSVDQGMGQANVPLEKY